MAPFTFILFSLSLSLSLVHITHLLNRVYFVRGCRADKPEFRKEYIPPPPRAALALPHTSLPTLSPHQHPHQHNINVFYNVSRTRALLSRATGWAIPVSPPSRRSLAPTALFVYMCTSHTPSFHAVSRFTPFHVYRRFVVV
jgi:hypothetical protein